MYRKPTTQYGCVCIHTVVPLEVQLCTHTKFSICPARQPFRGLDGPGIVLQYARRKHARISSS
jgi:hypothetical protein